MSVVLKQIAAIAKGLSKAELHVLIELASRAELAGGHDALASSRELAEQTGLARSSVQLAIDLLHRKGLIHSDAGTATRSAMHRLIFLDAVENAAGGPTVGPVVARESGQGGLKTGPVVAHISGQGGPAVRPVVARNSSQSGLKIEPEVAQVPGQGGPAFKPLSNGNSGTCEQAHIENTSAPADSIEKNDFDKVIDRLQKSKKSDFDDAIFEEARNLIASHHAKFAREGSQIVGLPDDQITAQFLAIAEWPRLSNLLWDLMSERKASGHSYGWYVTVALQRIHGISPERVREIRARLKGAPAIRTESCVRSMRDEIGGNCLGSVPFHTRTARSDSFEQQIRLIAARKAIR